MPCTVDCFVTFSADNHSFHLCFPGVSPEATTWVDLKGKNPDEVYEEVSGMGFEPDNLVKYPKPGSGVFFYRY